MNKFIAILCVLCWCSFWIFGYLALSAAPDDKTQVIAAMVLSALGFLGGTFAYMRLGRARPMAYKRVDQE